MGATTDDVSIGCLEYAMEADFTKTGSLSGENGAEEIVQTAAFALLSIYIIKEDGAGATCYSGIRVFAFAYQGASQGLEGKFFDFGNHKTILGNGIVQ